jgi:hypothetical protein
VGRGFYDINVAKMRLDTMIIPYFRNFAERDCRGIFIKLDLEKYNLSENHWQKVTYLDVHVFHPLL